MRFKKIFLGIISLTIMAQANIDFGFEGTTLSKEELARIRSSNSKEDKALKEALFWHHTIPTTGLRTDSKFFPPKYPYIPHFFPLWQLTPSKGKGIKIALIDTDICKNDDLATTQASFNVVKDASSDLPDLKVLSKEQAHLASHGCHTLGLVAGQIDNIEADSPDDDHGISGISPQASIIMIKTFKSDGTSTKSILIEALKKAIEEKVDIVNLSLKIADEIDLDDPSTKELESLIGQIPYVVVASGNADESKLSYPARFEGVTFDVGAFRYNDKSGYPIFDLSQYEPGIGPLFVAPGFNILSSGIAAGGKQGSHYIFMGGTSMATAIMSGFVALMLGEFKNDFTKKQLVTVAYASGIKMHTATDNSSWKERTVLGVLDMRTALFILHSVKTMKKVFKENAIDYDINAHFEQIIQGILHLLYKPVSEYYCEMTKGDSERCAMDPIMKRNFAKLLKETKKNKKRLDVQKACFRPTSLENAYDYITNCFVKSLKPMQQIRLQCTQKQVDAIRGILNQKKSTLFQELGPQERERVRRKLVLCSEDVKK